MPKFRDTLTGKILEFDHEPTQEELNTASSSGNVMPPQREEASPVAPGLGGLLGGLIGGKTPLGKVGAGIGAAAGTAYGDLYNMITHGVGDTTPASEAARLATVGGLTTAAETAIPPILRGVHSIKEALLPQKGFGILGSGLAGAAFGHPGYGAAAGAVIDAAPKVADAVDWLGTPAGTSEGNAARDSFLAKTPTQMQGRPEIQSQANAVGDAARQKAAGPLGDVPDYLQQKNWGNSLRDAGSYMKDKATGAIDALEGLFGGAGAAARPQAPPSPTSFRVPKSLADIAERTGVSGQYSSSLPDMSRNPEVSWSADVSASPMRTPQLSQTSPTDPEMAWDEYTGRTSPKRAASGGRSFGSVEVNSPLAGLKAVDPAVAPSVQPAQPPPVGVHDAGLQKWLESGGTPEGYATALARGRLQPSGPIGAPEGYGPNTVGAAQKKFVAPLPQPRREFPLGWTPDTPLSRWNELGANDAEAHAANDPGTQDLMDRLQVIIRNALDSAKR